MEEGGVWGGGRRIYIERGGGRGGRAGRGFSKRLGGGVS